MLLTIIGASALAVIAHEVGHIVITRVLGGRFLGVEFRGYAIGVRLSVTHLSQQQVAWTLIAGPLAETIVIALALYRWPSLYLWWVLILGLNWCMNVVPWGLFPNDGTRIWHIWRHGTI